MKTSNNFTLVLLFILFISPGLLAYEFFLHPSWLGATTNKGNLLEPEKFSIAMSKPTWRLILWYPKNCDESCLKQIDIIAKIRLALGRHLYEVESLLLLDKEQQLSQDLRKYLDAADIKVLFRPYPPKKSKYLMSNPQIFITNPKNYLILSYSLQDKAEFIFQDLQHLLRSTTRPLGKRSNERVSKNAKII